MMIYIDLQLPSGSIGSAVAQVHWDFMERMPQIWVGRSIAAEEVM